MILIFVVALLVIGIAFYQAVQGLFSALVMCILSITCAMLAFSFYEPLGSMLYNSQPAYADGAALVALFFIPLLGLRIVADRFIPGNSLVGLWPDRIGGGLLGLITAEVCVGVLMVAVQMLPWGQTMLGYTAFSEDLTERKQRLAPFYPDEFTVGLVEYLSAKSFKADPERPYATAHDNLLRELFCARNTGTNSNGVALGGSTAVMPGTLKIGGAFVKPKDGELSLPAAPPKYPLGKDSDDTIIVRVIIDEKASARDEEDNVLRLAGTQFRLVTASGKSYYPVAYLTDGKTTKADASGKSSTEAGWYLWSAVKDNKTQVANLALSRVQQKDQKSVTVDWVYRLPLGEIEEMKKKSAYVAFRRNAVAEISPKQIKEGMPPTAGALEPAATK
ncbi:MAG: CvpA family protein [Planctomycetaceae bacterium]|nr:MAG: CvpA family protein [Planctomycetaceae bacterium]